MSSFVFIDSRVGNIEQLIAGLSTDVEVVILDPAEDGIAQIAAALAGVTDLDSIHIISHGSEGALYLGATVLTEGNLDDYATALAQIGASLSEGGDLLLYGCNVAAGATGQSFIESLALYTGADVAASTDLTGAKLEGGDWTLEAAAGTIESGAILSASTQEAYTYTLASFWGTAGDDTLAGGATDDTLIGLEGNDLLAGGDGADALYGYEGGDTLDGGAGDDVLWGDFSSVGNDSLSGGAGDDELYGGAGDDTLAGGAGKDTVYGDDGNDTYFVTGLNDVLLDSSGDDTVVVSVDGYKVPSAIEHVVWKNGAQPLPYFVDALYSDARWGEFGDPVTLTYGFLTSATAGATTYGSTDFRPMTAPEEDLVRVALAQWAEITRITFVEQADALDANIRFGVNQQPSSSGYAYYPTQGDVYIDADYVLMNVLLHEIGHSLGLKHPGDYGGTPPYLPPDEDLESNTVMSYNGWGATELGVFDVAAIQYAYGVDPGARSGNDTYLLSGEEHLIWDGSGSDTVSAAGSAAAAHIDLNDGRWNWIGTQDSSILAPGQYFISYNSRIENAVGGSGADAITGNDFANRLDGGAGNDTLDGAAGNDTIDGGQGNDRLIGGAGTDVLSYAFGVTAGVTVSLAVATAQATGGSGSDTVSGFERLTGSTYADKLTGNGARNLLSGLNGNDTLSGGAGNDTLTGGAGADRFDFKAALNATTNVDRITGFNAVNDLIRLDDDIFTAFTTANGALDGGAFYKGAGVTTAHDATDRIIYDSSTGNLYYDPDGTGTQAATLFATLGGTPAPEITAADFFIVA